MNPGKLMVTQSEAAAFHFPSMQEAFQANKKGFTNRGNVLRKGDEYVVWIFRNGRKEWLAKL